MMGLLHKCWSISQVSQVQEENREQRGVPLLKIHYPHSIILKISFSKRQIQPSNYCGYIYSSPIHTANRNTSNILHFFRNFPKIQIYIHGKPEEVRLHLSIEIIFSDNLWPLKFENEVREIYRAVNSNMEFIKTGIFHEMNYCTKNPIINCETLFFIMSRFVGSAKFRV